MANGEAADARLAQEVEDTYRRGLVGGLFYVAAWGLVAGWSEPEVLQRPLFWVLGAGFLLLAVLRVPRPPPPGPAQRRWRDRQWALVLAMSGVWGGFAAWVFAGRGFEHAETIGAVATVAFGTAFAHTFCMRKVLAAIGIAMLMAPMLVVLWIAPDDRGTALVMSLYCMYLVLALGRSHVDYVQRLDLDDALRAQRDAFAQLSVTDPLTGLANRRRFVEVLESASRGEPPRSLLIIDLDHFKQINDQEGHAFGDACLVAFAARLRESFPHATVARLGGEEFGVVTSLPTATALEAAERFVQGLRHHPVDTGQRLVAVTASIGVAPITADAAVAFARADAAMYRAKAAGRARAELAEG